MLNESQQKVKPRKHSVPARKRQDETNDVQIEIEKGKEEKKNIRHPADFRAHAVLPSTASKHSSLATGSGSGAGRVRVGELASGTRT